MEQFNEEMKAKKYVFECKHYDMSNLKHISIFLLGFAGLQVVSILVSIVVAFFMTKANYDLEAALDAFTKFNTGDAYNAELLDVYLQYAIYMQVISYIVITVCCLASLLKKDFLNIFKDFKNKNSWIYGLVFGALLVAGSSFIGLIINFIRGETEVNANESMIRLLSDKYYIPMFIVTVFCAPIVEEITYRLCVFGFLNKKNKWVALIFSALIFAFLHFDFAAQGEDMINELWNLPVYIYSGVILALAYSREGRLSDSIVAHALNNGLSMILMLIPTETVLGII